MRAQLQSADGREISSDDLLTMRKLKNTDTTSYLHIDQCNLPSESLIRVVASGV